MLSPEQILEAARRKWPMVLRSDAAGENAFPLRIPFGRPSTSEDFSVVSPKIEALAKSPYPWRVSWEIVETRRWGQQRWPATLEFDTIDGLASALSKEAELLAIRQAIHEARTVCPALEPWLRKNAHRIWGYLDIWSSLVAVCAFFAANPLPRCYPRQVAVSTDTKFLERNTGILRELLDVTLSNRVSAAGDSFAERFGLTIEPPQVRFKFLDSDLQTAIGWPVTESTVPVPSLRELSWNIPRAVVVENRDVFLCLPRIRDTLAIWGAGKAAPLLAQLPWLTEADIVYWGDCDEAGFSILSSLRSAFPQVRSVLMDLETWERWKHLAVRGKRDRSAMSAQLTSTESEALAAVVAGPWVLEQERIPPADADRALVQAFTS